MADYAHCRGCEVVLNLDTDIWYTDGNNTFCSPCWDEEQHDVCDGDLIVQPNGNKICNACGVEFSKEGQLV